MRKQVTKQSKSEYIQQQIGRYRGADKVEQGILLDEMMKVTGYHRKAIIRHLNKQPPPVYPKAVHGHTHGAGRPVEYGAGQISTFLRCLWHSSGQICSKRLQAIVPLWLEKYSPRVKSEELSLEHQVLIVRMSHSTIDRILAPERHKHRADRGWATTKPGTYLKQHIPIKTDQWNETEPGFVEMDTVAHCGTSLAGMFVYTLNTVDIASLWTEPRAIWGKGQTGVVKALEDIEESLPFDLLGADVDNGSEFINYHVDQYLTGRKRPVAYTRSREYHKNDNAHIEGRNWTHVRQQLGYARIDNEKVVALLNDLYKNEFSHWVNIFLPSVKLTKKERIGSQIKKHHDRPTTPCRRLLASPKVSEKNKARLRLLEETLNPFELHRIVEAKIKAILRQCHPQTTSEAPGGRKEKRAKFDKERAEVRTHTKRQGRLATRGGASPGKRKNKNNKARKQYA